MTVAVATLTMAGPRPGEEIWPSDAMPLLLDKVVDLKEEESAEDERPHLFGLRLAGHAIRCEVLTIVSKNAVVVLAEVFFGSGDDLVPRTGFLVLDNLDVQFSRKLLKSVQTTGPFLVSLVDFPEYSMTLPRPT